MSSSRLSSPMATQQLVSEAPPMALHADSHPFGPSRGSNAGLRLSSTVQSSILLGSGLRWLSSGGCPGGMAAALPIPKLWKAAKANVKICCFILKSYSCTKRFRQPQGSNLREKCTRDGPFVLHAPFKGIAGRSMDEV